MILCGELGEQANADRIHEAKRLKPIYSEVLSHERVSEQRGGLVRPSMEGLARAGDQLQPSHHNGEACPLHRRQFAE